jgi:hypothetical protein
MASSCMGEWMYRSTFCLTSALAGGEWSSHPSRFNPGTHWIGGWVHPRASLDDMEKRKFLTLLVLELRPLGHPARSQSLYRLPYPGSNCCIGDIKINRSFKNCKSMLGIFKASYQTAEYHLQFYNVLQYY